MIDGDVMVEVSIADMVRALAPEHEVVWLAKDGAEAVEQCARRKPDLVLMDGSLFAPKEYKQETIIKGDEKVPLISAGSIIAKVSRDRVMVNMHHNVDIIKNDPVRILQAFFSPWI